MQKSTNAMNVTDLRFQNAFATKPCPGCWECGKDRQGYKVYDGFCRAYVLDGVRVDCPLECVNGQIYWAGGTGPGQDQSQPCNGCQGRGEVPVEDGWAWWRAIHKAGIWLSLHTNSGKGPSFACYDHPISPIVAWLDDPELAFHQALCDALSQNPEIQFLDA